MFSFYLKKLYIMSSTSTQHFYNIEVSTLTEDNFTEDERRAALEEFNRNMVNAVLPVTVFVAIEAVLGFVGNIMVIYVFLFHYKHCNFRYFVLSLAFTDLLSCMTTVPGEVLTQLNWYAYPYPVVCKIKSFFNIFTVSSEAFALVIIAIDRYLKVCWPFGVQISQRNARFLVLVLYLMATLLAFPVSLLWGTHTEQETHKGMNITVTICEKDQEFMGTEMPLNYSLSTNIIIGTSLAVMFILYIFVARRLLLNKSTKGSNPACSRTKWHVSFCNTCTDVCMSKKNIENPKSPSEEILSDEPVGKLRIRVIEESAFSSSTSSTTDVRNKGYISDEGLSSSDLESNTRGKNKRKRTKTAKSTRGASQRAGNHNRLRRKTLIMVILTVAFIITTVTYLVLLSFIANGILRELSDVQRVVYFFFFRLYFINHVINPVIYGLLDPTFQRVLKGCREGTIKGSSTGPTSSSRD